VLCQCTRNPNAPSREFGFALCCEQGGRLHYFEAFMRRLARPLHEPHPQAVLTFVDGKA
jgi:hypothetical protein